MPMRIARVLCCLLIAVPLFGQSEEQGWRVRARFQGSFNELGQIYKAEPTVGYALNRHFEIYAGLPVYFVKNSTTPLEGGLGNAALGLTLDLNSQVLHFNSNLVTTAPTGNREKGFSTGHVTADWTNTFSRSFDTFVPYASIGIANTVSDTSFFVRPFSSEGVVTHFEVGGIYALNSVFNAGASYYGVRARGEQQIIVRERIGRTGETVLRRQIIQESAKDDGFSAWLGMYPGDRFDYIVGYSRSSAYELDSLFFGIGFRVK